MRAPAAAWSKTEQSVRCHDGTKDIIMHIAVCVKVASDLLWAVQVLGPRRLASVSLHARDDQRSNKWHDAGCCVFGPTLWHPERLTRAIVLWWRWCMDIHQGNRFLSDRAWIMTLLIWPCRRVGGDGWFDSKPLFAVKWFLVLANVIHKIDANSQEFYLHSFSESCLLFDKISPF
jgi:hypothetical protein